MANTEHFWMIKNPEGTFHIECAITIYYEKFRKYPDFLKDFEKDENARLGYPTAFCFLLDDDLQEDEANALLMNYREKYNDMVERCEWSGKWDEFPFKKNFIVFSK